MKASELLIKQHDEVRELFKKLEKGTGDVAGNLRKLGDSVAAHMVIEQELYYPAVMKADEDLVLEGYEEHAIARFALKRLMKTDPEDRTFHAKVKAVKELLDDHHDEEEEDLFPKAEKALGDSSEPLCKEMKALFEKTLKKGFEKNVSPGGAAVVSAVAP